MASADESKVKHQQQLAKLSYTELSAYLAFFCAVIATAGWSFRVSVSDQSLLELDPRSLTDGYLGFKMDNTFQDFNYFLALFGKMLATLTAHLFISRVTSTFCSLQIHQAICAAYTLTVSCILLSPRCTCLFLSFHLASNLAGGTGHILPVWLSVLTAFLGFSGSAYGDRRRLSSSLSLDSLGAHLFYPISGYLYCRLLSVGLWVSEICSSESRRSHRLLASIRCLPATLHYTFYLPNFLGAPVVTMEDFASQTATAAASRTGRSAVHGFAESSKLACRLLLWLGVAMVTLHALPVGAYLETLGLRSHRRQSGIDFCAVSLSMYARGHMFMLEYVQYYGWPWLFAALDGLDLPRWPACICRVTSYREMWRLFDRGLFSIVKAHVYLPLGGNRRGLLRQLGATASCFGFICLYHGNYDSVQAWIGINLAWVGLEIAAVKAWRMPRVRNAMLKWFSPRCLRRLIGCLAAANLIPPSVGIFYLLYGTYAGNLLMREILWKPLTLQGSTKGFAVFCATFYCTAQLAIEYKLRRGQE